MYGEMLIMELDKEGKFQQVKVIPRHMGTLAAENGSFDADIKADQVRLIYNDHEDNLTIGSTRNHARQNLLPRFWRPWRSSVQRAT